MNLNLLNSNYLWTFTLYYYLCICSLQFLSDSSLISIQKGKQKQPKIAVFVEASVVRYSFTINQQPRILYDYRGTSIFDPDGKVLQLEYAIQATKLMSSVVGLTASITRDKDTIHEVDQKDNVEYSESSSKEKENNTKNIFVLGSITRRSSRRQYPSYEILQRNSFQVDNNLDKDKNSEQKEFRQETISPSSHLIAPGIVAIGTGLTTDVQLLYDFIAMQCISYKYLYDSSMPLDRLVQSLSKEMRSAERKNNPYAVSMLLVSNTNKDRVKGRENKGGDISMYEISPSGSYLQSSSAVIGRSNQLIEKTLLDEVEKNNKKKMNAKKNTWMKRKPQQNEENESGWETTIQVVMKSLMTDVDYLSQVLSLQRDSPSKKYQPIDVSLVLIDSDGRTDNYSTTLPNKVTKKGEVNDDQENGTSILVESGLDAYELILYIKSGLIVSIPIISSY